MEHTKEPWEWSEHQFNAPPFEGTLDHECGIYPPDGEIGPVAIASGKNDARRIVACVNACAGVTTEELEQGGFVTGLVERLEDAPRWRDVIDELPQEAQEVLFVRGGKTVHGAWIGGIFWHSNQKMAAAKWMPMPKPPEVGADSTAEPNCDRSQCGDFSPWPCDHSDCPAIGTAPDDMIAMENAQGKKFALKFNPEHQQHGWIFYDNHGQWVTLRRALPHEIERAKAVIEMRKVLAGVPCKG